MSQNTDARGSGEVEQQLDAEQKNGVYLLGIETEFEGYTVRSGIDQTHVMGVEINGNYVGPDERFETECDDYTIEDGTLTLWYSEGDCDV